MSPISLADASLAWFPPAAASVVVVRKKPTAAAMMHARMAARRNGRDSSTAPDAHNEAEGGEESGGLQSGRVIEFRGRAHREQGGGMMMRPAPSSEASSSAAVSDSRPRAATARCTIESIRTRHVRTDQLRPRYTCSCRFALKAKRVTKAGLPT